MSPGLSTPDELNLYGTRYNTALVIFFVPYCLFEIPSNLLLKKFRPNYWLAGCMFMFGLVSICQGLVSNYGGLLTTRFFLGLFETGMFPGCKSSFSEYSIVPLAPFNHPRHNFRQRAVEHLTDAITVIGFYLIGMWYRREEAQRRYTFFFLSTTLAGAFGGLLASAIGLMDGLRGYRGWRWIFILEGTLTCVVSLFLFFILPVFPEEAKWLTQEEKLFIKARLADDQGKSAVERKITAKDVGKVFKDPKVIVGGFMYFGMIVTAYGYAYFSPAIIQGFGYSAIETQLHSVPPWAAAFGFGMIIAYASDKMRHRFFFVCFPLAVCICGLAMLLGIHKNLHAEYAALFLVAMGAYSGMPVIVCWFNMNLGESPLHSDCGLH